MIGGMQGFVGLNRECGKRQRGTSGRTGEVRQIGTSPRQRKHQHPQTASTGEATGLPRSEAALTARPSRDHLKYSAMTCRSYGEAGIPFRLASITRRQISTVAWSPRSLAASSTIQAASTGFSDVRSSEAEPGSLRAPNDIAFMTNTPSAVFSSSHCIANAGCRLALALAAASFLRD